MKLCDACGRRRAALAITLRPGTHSITHRCPHCTEHVDKRTIASSVPIPMLPEERYILSEAEGETPE